MTSAPNKNKHGVGREEHHQPNRAQNRLNEHQHEPVIDLTPAEEALDSFIEQVKAKLHARISIKLEITAEVKPLEIEDANTSQET